MGQAITTFVTTSFFSIFGNKVAKMVMLGLDAAGKTTILYHLQLNEHIEGVPTIGFNVETIQYKNINLNVWDVGGQSRIRKLWGHYFDGCDAIIFVVDSADTERIEMAKQELHSVLSDHRLNDALLLVYANKQDMPGAVSPEKLVEMLGLCDLRRKKEWFMQPSCAIDGSGLYEGLDWLASRLP